MENSEEREFPPTNRDLANERGQNKLIASKTSVGFSVKLDHSKE